MLDKLCFFPELPRDNRGMSHGILVAGELLTILVVDITSATRDNVKVVSHSSPIGLNAGREKIEIPDKFVANYRRNSVRI